VPATGNGLLNALQPGPNDTALSFMHLLVLINDHLRYNTRTSVRHSGSRCALPGHMQRMDG